MIPPPYSMLWHIGRVAKPKFVPRNCLRHLQESLIMREGDWSQNLCEVLSKKQKKNKRRFRKTLHFFILNSPFLMFGICKIVSGLIGLFLDHFDTQKRISWTFLVEYTIKLLEKLKTPVKLLIHHLLPVKEYWTSIKRHAYIYDTFSSFLSVYQSL